MNEEPENLSLGRKKTEKENNFASAKLPFTAAERIFVRAGLQRMMMLAGCVLHFVRMHLQGTGVWVCLPCSVVFFGTRVWYVGWVPTANQ